MNIEAWEEIRQVETTTYAVSREKASCPLCKKESTTRWCPWGILSGEVVGCVHFIKFVLVASNTLAAWFHPLTEAVDGA